MSPHTSDFSGDIISPITSPPATPLSVHDIIDQAQQQQTDLSHRSSSLHNVLRRRTISSSIRSQRDDTMGSAVEEEHVVSVNCINVNCL